MIQGKKRARALWKTAGVGGQTSRERFAEIRSGRIDAQPGTTATGKDPKGECKSEPFGRAIDLAHEPVGAKTVA
jgi:hypothetical protein